MLTLLYLSLIFEKLAINRIGLKRITNIYRRKMLCVLQIHLQLQMDNSQYIIPNALSSKTDKFKSNKYLIN